RQRSPVASPFKTRPPGHEPLDQHGLGRPGWSLTRPSPYRWLGNYFNHELFGLPTTLPWGLEIFPTDPMFPAGLPAGTLFHPLFLYEIIWNLIGVAVILVLERRVPLRWGRTFGVYLIWYGLGRSWLEAIRIDPTSDAPLGIPANVWASFIAIALGIILIMVQTRRHPAPETSVYRTGREPEVVSTTGLGRV
ncbi:prolipoprotein diacylglyceryl transferase, partial [Microbacterium aurantiacum]|uniref:prolipoprotein diacylglyceryl transferase n=2 Tax=Microbacterium aurantiacum TaxID=162393 RepID=UPI004036BFF0